MGTSRTGPKGFRKSYLIPNIAPHIKLHHPLASNGRLSAQKYVPMSWGFPKRAFKMKFFLNAVMQDCNLASPACVKIGDPASSAG